jgi:hypothetical protein
VSDLSVPSVSTATTDAFLMPIKFLGLLIFSTVRPKTPAFPPSTRMSGSVAGGQGDLVWNGRSQIGTEGKKDYHPCDGGRNPNEDVTNFPGSNMFVSYFQTNRSNRAPRILREIVP